MSFPFAGERMRVNLPFFVSMLLLYLLGSSYYCFFVVFVGIWSGGESWVCFIYGLLWEVVS
jgi:hypothetical protein